MGQLWNDKRIRQLAIAVLVVILALGLLSLVSTVFQMIVPLALVIGGGVLFYKIVIEGRDAPDAVEAMDDELAESSGIAAADLALDEAPADAQDDDDSAALERLSAAERAPERIPRQRHAGRRNPRPNPRAQETPAWR